MATRTRGKSKNPARSQIRKLIDDFAVGRNLKVHPLGYGEMFVVPSGSDLGGYYIVGELAFHQYVCECKGFRFDQKGGDECQHVRKVKAYKTRRRDVKKRKTV